jgi:hypothetical protein
MKVWDLCGFLAIDCVAAWVCVACSKQNATGKTTTTKPIVMSNGLLLKSSLRTTPRSVVIHAALLCQLRSHPPNQPARRPTATTEPGVTVHDMTTFTPAQVNGMVNGPGTTIGAFCNSGACLPK